MKLKIKDFFDPATYTLTYVVFDEDTRDAVIIDPVLDYDPASSRVSHHSIQHVSQYIDGNHLKVHAILETHAHADHLSGSQILKEKYPQARVVIGAKIQAVQKLFKNVFQLDDSFKTDGSQFDQLMEDGEVLTAGSLKIKTLFTPGHTPACASYLVEDVVFTGDALFMPDYGTGRCDFPSGSAEDLYESIHERLYKLPDHTRVFVGHDYQVGRKDVLFESTIGKEKVENIQLSNNTSKEQFIAARNKRDKGLAAPRLLLPSVQININAGRLPKEEANGSRFLKIPIR